MKRIGPYRVEGLLGQGGMGRVYKVVHPVIGRTFALKRLEPAAPLQSLVGAQRLRALFADEIRRMASLTHPHILGIIDADDRGARPYYVMDYHCNNLGQEIGETYRAEMPSRPLPVPRAVAYSRQILSGLARLHHAGIVHRDIKPFNILLTTEGQVKICDFGLSRLRGEKFGAPDTLKVGSPFYTAPEQETNPDQADFSADLYATGVMLYRMLTGRLPDAPLKPASHWRPDLDSDWNRFLRQALAPAPAVRYQQAGVMRDDLTALFERWQDWWANTCRGLPEQAREAPENSLATMSRIRTTPIKTGPRATPAQFGLDLLWRPRAYRPPRFRSEQGGELLADLSTGLTWQRSGSAFDLDWQGARNYIDQLNQAGFGGRGDWRLPTIDELITLLQPNPTGEEHCLPPIFDRRPERLWSCDRRTYTSAWYVNLDLGFVAWQDFSCLNAIKAVRRRRRIAGTSPGPPPEVEGFD